MRERFVDAERRVWSWDDAALELECCKTTLLRKWSVRDVGYDSTIQGEEDEMGGDRLLFSHLRSLAV